MKMVFINGYGTVGKRVADAVSMQRDMKVAGVSKTKEDYMAKAAAQSYPLYAVNQECLKNFKNLKIKGTVEDALFSGTNMGKIDIVVDCSPSKKGKENLEMYKRAGVKAIFQGGESNSIVETSFVASCNYEKAWNKDYARVVSCNTTGLSRFLFPLRNSIEKVYATLIRRSVDPWESEKGLIDAIEFETKMPSHHGPDVQTIFPINIVTNAYVVPTKIMHVHSIIAELNDEFSAEGAIKRLEKTPRIMFLDSADGISSTAQIMELAKEIDRNCSWQRNDLFENAVIKDLMNVKDNTLYAVQAIHQEADIIPENVDAIRAMLCLMRKEESIEETNLNLGISNSWLE